MTEGLTHTPGTPSNLIRFPALVAPLAAVATPAPGVTHLLRPQPGEGAGERRSPTGGEEARRVPDGAALAHDARNALASLELLSGLLAQPGTLTPVHAGLATDVRLAVDRLEALILELAPGRAQASPAAAPDERPQEAAARPIGVVLTGSQRILELTAGPAVRVYVSFESGLPAVTMADSLLERVLVNLVKNATEAMPRGGTIRITARRALSRTAPAILLQVIDDGPGIPAHALDHIFKAGFSSKRGTRPWQVECGLGLTIVRQLVEAAGGRVRAASAPRQGATFELRLPAAR